MSYMRNNDGKNEGHRAMVEFFIQAVENSFLSEKEGRPIFEDKEFIRIITPGDKHSVVEERVKPQHKEMYKREYEAFQANEVLSPVGTPLKEWAPMTPAMVANLRVLNILTVEQLAEVGDGFLDNIGMGARSLREKARIWLKQADDGAEVSRLMQENRTMKEQMEVMQKTIADMSAAVARLKPAEAA